MRRLIAILIFLCASIISMNSQELFFSHAFKDGALPIHSITALLQDSRGFIWIGTTDGLCRYDGQEIVVFRYNARDTNSISNNTIFDLMEDRLGRIWIGTSNGLNYYEPRTGKVYRYKKKGLFDKGDNDILSLESDKMGFIWVGTYNGLFKIDPKTEKYFQFLPNKEQSDLGYF